jgi:D-serine deaminase-like pyridoxal phosphate-dependent protein
VSELDALVTPAFLVDRDRVERNCARMRHKASDSNIIFRPHVKTHKTTEAARLQHGGVNGPITVSTIAEAEFFAAAGFDDITYAVPVAPAKLERLAVLARRLRQLNVLVDHPSVLAPLEAVARTHDVRFDLFVKVDCGYHRAGVDPDDPQSVAFARDLASSPAVRFRGLLTHAGHSYHARDREELQRLAAEESAALNRFRDAVGIPELLRSIGSTPTAMVVDRFKGCDEARPGNYVFFDAQQAQLGTCAKDDVAVSVMASVVGIYDAQKKLMVDAGSLALAREAAYQGNEYGVVCDMALHALPLALTTMSQEHGQLFFTGSDGEWSRFAATMKVGTRLRIIPNHSCITAAMYDLHHVVSEGRLVDAWRPVRGW